MPDRDLNIKSTKERISEIEKELSELKSERDLLISHWNLEKELIKSIRELKEQSEKSKLEADKLERESRLAEVAELRYGKIPSFEKEIMQKSERLAEIQKNRKMLKEEVDAEDIAGVVSKWTGIPVNKMLQSERSRLLKMEEILSKRVIGQEDAVFAISNAVRRTRAGLQDENRPIGSFLFMGTTGVGKTELARAVAEFLFDDEHAIIRIDMSEYMEKFSSSRLIGAPPGYVGYEEGGYLTEAVRRKPYSVVLLDEIEKAHQDIFNLLLQVLDEGRLTDSQGKTVNFKNTVIIMTSNIGSQLIQEQLQNLDENNRDEILGRMRVKLVDLLKVTIRPEFLNRIDEIILFKPLIKSDIRKIVDIQLSYLADKIERNGMTVIIDDDVKDWLGELGFNTQYGARPIKRTIQKYIANPLSEKILEGVFLPDDTIKITVNDKGVIDIIKA
ncbi:MAG: AAA family ATPase [Ignavibacteria bacterium]|nr:AAA family ATPase [Ignavibacteria bacterium]